MENFVVSARKYRPQNFNTVVGQAHITTTLKNAIRNQQLAHAFLFCGPRGVGKTTCARILAKTINCTAVTPEGEACNACSSCTSFDAGASMNIHELDAASNNSVDDIRALVEQVRFAPQAGKYKVYIIDEVHMLSSSAFNAFLKTLEEPPPYAIFILATTEKHKILPTILSRCQIFDFKRITTHDTVLHLQEIVTKESIDADKAALQVIAQKSEGCMRDSLSLLDKLVSFTNGRLTYQNTLEHLNILDDDYFFQLLDLLLAQDMAGAMLLFDQINRKGFEGDLVLNGFAEFIRNVLVCKDAKAAALLDVVEGQEARYQAVAAKTTTSYLVSALNVLNDTEVQYKMARNKRLHIELALIKLSFLQQALALTVEQGKVLKKRQVDQSLSLRLQPIASLAPNPGTGLVPTATAVQPGATLGSPALVAPPVASPMAAAAVTPQQTIPSSKDSGAKLFVDPSLLPPLPEANKAKPSMLDMIRQKVGQSYTVNEIPEALPLTQVALMEFWQAYTVQLEKQLKHSAAGTFKIAGLELDNEQHFTVRVTALTAQKFIEQEKTELLDQLQRKFNNRSIQFDVLVEAGEQENVPLHLRLTSREKFEHLAKTYPLLKELKDRLKLEIDY